MNNSSPFPVAPIEIARRNFIKTSAALAVGSAVAGGVIGLTAAQRARSIGANDRIRIGIIGCGDRARRVHMPSIHKHVAETNFEIVALCDPWRIARAEANALVKEWYGREAKEFTTYRDLLAMRDLDAVMIASPDFHHTTHLEAAARAGKHIYVEKPLATEMDKLVRACDAVKQAGTIVQVGTQLRSYPSVVGSRELMRSGLLGKLSRIEEVRNSEKPYWYRYLSREPEVRSDDVDWNEFLGDREKRPFNARQFVAWYGYYEFCQGPIPQWGAHFIDMAHFITGCGFPESCMCNGGIFSWKDENNFTVPDCVQGSWIYPEGFLLTSSNNFGNGYGNTRKFYGDKGVLKIDNANAPTYSAEGGGRRDGRIRGQNEVKPIESPDHFLNWLQCMRDGRTPNAPIEAGYHHAVAVLMAVRSYETGRRIVYDPKSRSLKAA